MNQDIQNPRVVMCSGEVERCLLIFVFNVHSSVVQTEVLHAEQMTLLEE